VAKFTNMRFEPAGLTDDPDIRIASSVMDYIFRRLALDHLPYEDRAALGILSAAERTAEAAGYDPAELSDDPDPEELAQSAAVEQPLHTERAVVSPPAEPSAPAGAERSPAPPAAAPHSSTELIEAQQGRTADAPLCLTCGTKMRPAGSCYVCEGCGSTSGCS
jgi:ribonucleoside-diphosphate reductase alpha chain